MRSGYGKGVIQSALLLLALGASPHAAAEPPAAPTAPIPAASEARKAYGVVVVDGTEFSKRDGRIGECDYENGVIRIHRRLESHPAWFVVRDVVAHEVGHALGLNHEDAKTDEPSIMATSIHGAPIHWPAPNELTVYRNRSPARWIALKPRLPADFPRTRRAVEWAAAMWNQAGDRDAVVVLR